MKKYLHGLRFAALAIVCGASSLGTAQTLSEWDDVSITQLNREPAHCLSIPVNGWEGHADALEEDVYAQSPFYKSLNGVWKFNWVSDPSQRPTGFEAVDFNDASWDEIDVPATWQVYGLNHGKAWDKPLYCNVAYPFSFDKTSFSVMAERPSWFTYNSNMMNPVGSYRRSFSVPADWAGRDVYVRFNGAGHGYYVWVNGQFAGYAEDSYLPSEFKITDLLKSGDNTIAVQVYRFTSGSLLEAQDYWRLTGITRDVFLWSAPKSQIRDFFVTNNLTSNYASADINVAAEITGAALTNGKLTLKVLDDQGAEAASTEVAVSSTSDTPLTKNISVSLASPKLWNAEQPNLYTVVLVLNDGTQDIDIRTCKWGVRDIKVGSKGEILFNGKPLLIHGVDRHDHSAKYGRAVTREEMRQDIFLMKALNINAIRTSHYPNNPYLYDLCDKYGIYVLAEANVECHPYQQLSSESAFKPIMVERNERHVLSLRNHPSIFMWSFGNESGGGTNFKAVSEAIYALDNTRLRHYEGNSDWSDVTSTMYAGVDHISWIGSSRANESNPKPHVQCENTHAMGNSMGNQREFYDLYEKYNALAGEFIWDWKDQGLETKVPDGEGTYFAYGGDFGDNPNDGNFCCNGVIFPDYTYSAKALNVKKIYQPADFDMKSAKNGKFVIRNKMAFANLDQYAFSYQILEDGIVLSEQPLSGISIAGGEKQEIVLENLLPENAADEAEYFIRFSAKTTQAMPWAAAGYEVASEQYSIRKPLNKPVYVDTLGCGLSISELDNAITVGNSNFSASFSRSKGQLDGYRFGDIELFSESPIRFNAFRVPTDNDGSHASQWDNAGLRTLTVTAGTWKTSENPNGSVTLTITNTCKGKNGTSFEVQMSYNVFSDGTISVSSLIDPASPEAVLPRIGFTFEVDSIYHNFAWYGRGPWENYRDRKESCFPGLYHSTVAEQWTPYMRPQENGNHEEVRFIALTDASGRGLQIVAPEQMSAGVSNRHVSNIYTNSSSRKRHDYQVPLHSRTIVNLDAAMRALGNNSCGPDVLSDYELKAQRTGFSFMLMPITEPLTDTQLVTRARVANTQCSPVEVVANKGKISMTCATPDASIYYSLDGGENYLLYTSKFDLSNGGNILAYAEKEGMDRSLISESVIQMYINKSGWKVVRVDSEQGGSEKKENAIDGNSSTIWHTKYSPSTDAYPHEIDVDMGAEYNVRAFVYQGRGDMENGRVKKYEVYFSLDGTNWGEAAAKGNFSSTGAEQEAELKSIVRARYFRFRALSEVNGNAWASAAELGIRAVSDEVSVSTAVAPLADNTLFHLNGQRAVVGEKGFLIGQGKIVMK